MLKCSNSSDVVNGCFARDEQNKSIGNSGNSSLEQLKGLEQMFGPQFENLVLNNLQTLFLMLSLDASLVLSAAPYCQRAASGREGCQIDLMIQTQRMVMVVEIKRRREIGHEVIDEVAEKVRRLKFSSSLSLRTALVYEGRLSPSVAADRYFDFIIPAERLFES